jgi:hypothetical protein
MNPSLHIVDVIYTFSIWYISNEDWTSNAFPITSLQNIHIQKMNRKQFSLCFSATTSLVQILIHIWCLYLFKKGFQNTKIKILQRKNQTADFFISNSIPPLLNLIHLTLQEENFRLTHCHQMLKENLDYHLHHMISQLFSIIFSLEPFSKSNSENHLSHNDKYKINLFLKFQISQSKNMTWIFENNIPYSFLRKIKKIYFNHWRDNSSFYFMKTCHA